LKQAVAASADAIPLPHFNHPLLAAMNDHPDAATQFGCRLSEEMTEEDKELLDKIDSESILNASIVKGSLYFYIIALGDKNQSKEELIDDPAALAATAKDLGIEINYENKHHRWIAQASHALKILAFAATHLSLNGNTSPTIHGINTELKWRDEKGFENIIHLTRSKDNTDWQVTRYA
jgi:hypothetical protein